MRPNLPSPEESGPRRPQPHPGLRRYSISTAQLRTLPPSPWPCIRLVNYELPADTLPNGLPRPLYVAGVGVLRVGDAFHLCARIVRPASQGLRLEVDTEAYDLITGRNVAFLASPSLLRGIYDELSRAHVLARARRYTLRAGRN